MSLVILQGANGAVYGTAAPFAYPKNVTKGSLLTASFTRSSAGVTSITDTIGNAWAPAGNANITGAQIWFAVSKASGANSITPAGGGSWESYMQEVAGFPGIPMLDQSGNATGAGSVPTVGPLVTIRADEFLVAIFSYAGTAAGGGANWIATVTPNVNLFEYLDASVAGSYTATATPSDSGWKGAFATFGAAPITNKNDAVFFNAP